MKAAVLYEVKKPVEVQSRRIAGARARRGDGQDHGERRVPLGLARGEGRFGDIVPLPSILGHEGAGIVEAVGPNVQGGEPGRPRGAFVEDELRPLRELRERLIRTSVSAPPVPEAYPTAGDVTLYPMAGVGTMAEYAVVPDVAAVPIDKDIPFPQAALVGCGVTTGVGAAINTARVAAGSTVAVFGCGGVGLNVIQGAPYRRRDDDHRRRRAGQQAGHGRRVRRNPTPSTRRRKTQCGASRTSPAARASTTPSRPSGSSRSPSCRACTARASAGSRYGWVTLPVRTPVTIDARDLIMEKSIIGSMYGTARPHIEFNKLLGLYKAGPPQARRAHHPPLPPSKTSTTPSRPSTGAKSPAASSKSASPPPHKPGGGRMEPLGLHTRP